MEEQEAKQEAKIETDITGVQRVRQKLEERRAARAAARAAAPAPKEPVIVPLTVFSPAQHEDLLCQLILSTEGTIKNLYLHVREIKAPKKPVMQVKISIERPLTSTTWTRDIKLGMNHLPLIESRVYKGDILSVQLVRLDQEERAAGITFGCELVQCGNTA